MPLPSSQASAEPIDWQAGAWRAGGVAASPAHSMLIAGDWAPIGRYGPIMSSSPEAVYGDLLTVLRQADLRVVNLECPLVDEPTPIAKDGPDLIGARATVDALNCVPFEVACLANNHTMDHGADALGSTIALLGQHGIRTTGAGLTRDDALAPLVVEVGPTRLAIVNFSEGEDCTAATTGAGSLGWELDVVIDTVRSLRARDDIDVVVAIAHAGREHVPAPPPYVYDAFRRIAREGAHLVVGHHPHVPQGIEVLDGTPIVYSLGNFVFDMKTDLAYRRTGYMLSVDLVDRRLAGVRLVPYALDAGGLRLLDGDEKSRLFARLRVVSDALAHPDEVRDIWNAFIDHFGDAFWVEKCAGTERFRELMRNDPAAAAAKMRNLFVTPAHRYFMIDGLTRLVDGTFGTAGARSRGLVREWLTTPAASQ